jgi:hypothetical protein
MGKPNLRKIIAGILLYVLSILIIAALVWLAIWYLRKDAVEFLWRGFLLGLLLAPLPPIVVCSVYDSEDYEFLGESSPVGINFWRSIIPVLIAGFIGLACLKWMVTSPELGVLLFFLIPITLLPLITILCIRIVFFTEDLFFLIWITILPSNSKTLMNLAIKDYDSRGETAVEKIADPHLLAEVAIKAWRSVGQVAVEKITDQELLIKIAKADSHLDVKKAAMEKFDEEHKRLIPEIVEEVWQNKKRYYPGDMRDFIQSAYKISHQEQKQKLRKYDGEVLEAHTDVLRSSYDDEYGYTPHTDIPGVSIYLLKE